MTERVWALAVVAMLAAVPAGASEIVDWEIFVARCLGPMEEVKAPNTTGLAPLHDRPAWLAAPDGADFWKVSIGLVLVTTGNIETEPSSCALAFPPGDADAQFEADFAVWAAWAVADGRYAQIDTGTSGERVFESQEWREPRLRVLFSPGSGRAGPRVTAMETDLEA